MQCGGIDNLASYSDVKRLGVEMYNNATFVNGNFWYKNPNKPEERVFNANSAVAQYLGITNLPLKIWLRSYANYVHGAYSVNFSNNNAGDSYDYRSDSSNYAICVSK